MTRLRALLSVATACVLLAGCESTTTISPQPLRPTNPPTQVRVDGHELVLETWLWRDFMPIAPPDGQPLVAALRIKTTDGRPFPAGVTADQVTVEYGDVAWTATAQVERPSSQASVLEVIARDGPRWGPHVNVNVMVRLRDRDGREHWLGAVNQPIHRTD